MLSHPTLHIIRDEHGAVFAVMRSIDLLLSQHRRRVTLPDFTVLRAMLFYVDEFLEKVHHSKESALLFPKLRARSSELAEVLDRLDCDHARSQGAVRELEHDLLALEMMTDAPDGPSRLVRFEQSMKNYIASYLEHIRTEENLVLPMAERILTAADWAELDAAFMLHRDPLTRCAADDMYQPLFKRVLMTLASPPGLGQAMEAMRVSYAGADVASAPP